MDSFPLPLIDEIFDALHGAKYFTTLDATWGYWQVEVELKHQEKTAFVTHDGIFEFLVMPFGLCTAPATYQRAMNIVLKDLLWKNCLDFIDDICVFTKTTFQDHLKDIHQVFTKLRQANLVLNPEKCHFTRAKVELLGHVVSCNGLQVNPDKVKKLVEMRLPRNTSELRSFLGLASYYRRFVKDFAKIADPIIKMTRKDANVCWDTAAQISFNTLKQALTTAPVLAYPNSKKPFILTTDASSLALGAILTQEDDNKLEHVIAYASQTLN